MKRLVLVLCALIFSQVQAAKKEIAAGELYPRVAFHTSLGTMVFELNRNRAPITVNRFLTLMAKGEYNNNLFHRVEPGFVAQAGGFDTKGTPFKDPEPIFNESGNGLKNALGTIALARMTAPHSGTRQFFFNLNDNTHLDPGRRWGYTVFGTIVEGEEILDKFDQVETHFDEQLGLDNVPKQAIVLKKVELVELNQEIPQT